MVLIPLLLALSTASWVRHEGVNCYPGSGGSALDPDDDPIPHKTVTQCGAECESAEGCTAFTVDQTTPTGNCWLRSSIQLPNCDTSSGYDTYDGGPLPPPSPVHLDVRCDECTSITGYSYPLTDTHADWDCEDCHSTDWTCYNAAGELRNFTYLEMFQLVVEADNPSLKISVDLRDSAALPSKYSLFSRFLKDDYSAATVGPFSWGSELAVPVLADAPAHMTLVPTSKGDVFDEVHAYAIVVSVRKPPPTPKATVAVHVTGDLTWEDARNASTWSAASFDVSGGCAAPFTRPSWRWASDGSISYLGTLSQLQGECGEEADVEVVLADGITSTLPLTVTTAVSSGDGIQAADSSQQHALEQFLRHRLDGKRTWADVEDEMLETKVYWDGPRVQASEFARRLRVRGYGRLSGIRMVGKYGPTSPECSQPAKLRDVLELFEYSVLSGVLFLASSYPTHSADDPAVDIAGVTVAHGPHLSKGAIQANSAYLGMAEGDNNQAARLFDVKTAGTWIQASDGPDVMGRNSRLSYLFLHHADDTLKASVSGWHAHDITVLQGNVGGLIDLGSYGYIRGDHATGINISGVYVHRLAQIDQQYDHCCGALITTRNRYQGRNISNVSISGISIPNLGGVQSLEGTRGPNAIYRIFALGFFCGDGSPTYGPDYCSSDRRDTEYSRLSLHTSSIHIAPLGKNLFYELNPKDGHGAMRSVSFLTAQSASDFNYANYNATAFKVYPLPDEPSYFYCINADVEHPERGVDSDVISGVTKPSRLAANVEYLTRYGNDTLVQWDVQYPVQK